jgi:prevent-host-death family protein
MDKEIGVTEARKQFASLIEQVKHQHDSYVIIRNGKRAAALVPVEAYDRQVRERERLFEAIANLQVANQGVDPDDALADVLDAQRAVRSQETA